MMWASWLLGLGLAAGISIAVGWLGWVWWQQRRSPRVAVLLYHRLVPATRAHKLRGTEGIFALTDDRFAEHLAALRAAGFAFLTPEAIRAHRTGGAAHPGPAVHICFDDGNESVYRLAYPRLQSIEASATVFVTSNPSAWVFHLQANPQARLSREQLSELIGAGWAVGTHGVDHHPPSALSSAALEDDLRVSRDTLQEELGISVTEHAVPGNFLHANYPTAARASGHEAIWTARPAFVVSPAPPHALPRLNVEGHLSGSELVRALTPWGLTWRRALYETKRLPARLLGPGVWLPLRAALFRSPLSPWLNSRYLRFGLLAAAAAAVALAALLLSK